MERKDLLSSSNLQRLEQILKHVCLKVCLKDIQQFKDSQGKHLNVFNNVMVFIHAFDMINILKIYQLNKIWTYTVFMKNSQRDRTCRLPTNVFIWGISPWKGTSWCSWWYQCINIPCPHLHDYHMIFDWVLGEQPFVFWFTARKTTLRSDTSSSELWFWLIEESSSRDL